MDKAQSKARGAISIAGDWEGLQIEDNRIYRPSNKTGGTAILVSRANDPTIARNEIRWAGEGVRIQQLDDAVVEDNGIELFGTAGYYDAGIELNGVVGAAVSRNTTCGATGIWGDGVAIHGGGNHVLSDNQNLPTGCLASP
ncbi:MAG: right-handed parallel beta-helix repeat-containing protein [Myxococcota bacterium]|nr:right-handed parallel beta-helix repeat-containing protein [Myxococcota bacterium]